MKRDAKQEVVRSGAREALCPSSLGQDDRIQRERNQERHSTFPDHTPVVPSHHSYGTSCSNILEKSNMSERPAIQIRPFSMSKDSPMHGM
jgi:hypothetical protein